MTDRHPVGDPGVCVSRARTSAAQRLVILGDSAAITNSVQTALSGHGPVTRIGGADRFLTAVELSKAGFPTGVGTIFIASGGDFADAMAAGPAAARGPSPILLTTRDCIPARVNDEIDRLQPTRIIVLGDLASITDAVMRRSTCAT